MKMIGDYDLFIQLCENRGISAPPEVIEAIKICSSTGQLRLPCMSIVVPICEVLARILASSTTIRTVDLSDCMLLAKGLSNILNALCEGSNVTSINLKGNNINGDVVAQLGKIFRHNNTLKRLSIEWNSLGSNVEAFAIFCQGLGSNNNIEELDLRYNQISPHCAEPLAVALKTNKSLRVLDLAWNSLGIRGGETLLNAIEDNRGIIKLHLRGNCIPDGIINAIDECVYRNQRKIAVSQTNLNETIEIARNIVLKENFDSKQNKLSNESLVSKEISNLPLTFVASNETQKNNSELADSVLNAKIVGSGDIEVIDKHFEATEVKKKIVELNKMLQDRSSAIDLLTKELSVKTKETNASKLLINKLENEIIELKENQERFSFDKSQQIEELKENQRKTEEHWKKELKKLEESLKESLTREKELETKIQKYERELRKNSIEVANIKQKSILQIQSYEDLIAKSRIEIHRTKRETKERENRCKIEINLLRNNLKESKENLEECQTQLLKSKGELRETTENLSSVKTRLNEVERVNCRLVNIEESFQKLKDEKKSIEEKLSDSLRNISMLQRQVATLQNELIEPQRRYDLLKDELEQEREKSARFKKELAEERTRLRELNTQMQILNSQITALNNQINEIQNNHVETMREKDKEYKTLKEIISNKERDFNELKTEEVQRASQLYAAFSKYLGSIGPNTT